ncbi:mechanosensitive ion channel family protein [Taibaiella chishuiensis]|uniref:Small conductance mechanosensitive channel n=1 Tax=Taibaiella chishuiensis TaxID=1434707 RepID=A0A2P8DBM2_9BACT|nr:mechanosensitive ion channel domain-containing protein [Taibaiella chishuiensis]PSK94616.1 small conductance mechanosensitive channel [Taibaiella chishuiensis]
MVFLQINETLQAGTTALNTGGVWLDKMKAMAIAYAPKLVGAILVYLIGSWLIGKINALFRRVLTGRNFDASLQKFLLSLVRVMLTLLLFLAIAGMIGVDITGFAALLAGAGLAIGAALNGSLGNLAGGVMIMVFKPFKVNDMIEAQGMVGIVQEIGIFNTVVLSPENKTIILPNGALSTGVITNYTTHGNLRVDLSIAVALDVDIDKARRVAIGAMRAHPKVLQTPAPEVSVLKVADGMTTLAIRPYTLQADYWDVYFGVQELVKKAFDAHSIAGPIPTRVLINKV